MQKERFFEITNKLNLPENKRISLNEIDSIVLTQGRAILPERTHIKFVLDNGQLGIIYGHSEAIGGRLPFNFSFPGGRNGLMYNGRLIVPDTQYYENLIDKIGYPKFGCFLRVQNGLDKFTDYHVDSTEFYANTTFIKTIEQIDIYDGMRCSYYNALSNDIENCELGTVDEGIYLHFIDNDLKKRKYHEIIKPKDIQQINLKIGNTVFNKTYRLE